MDGDFPPAMWNVHNTAIKNGAQHDRPGRRDRHDMTDMTDMTDLAGVTDMT